MSLNPQAISPVLLVSLVDGKLQMDLNDLDAILINVISRDKDVAIISAVGSQRSGKSWILNILKQYLDNKHERSKGIFSPPSVSNSLCGFPISDHSMSLHPGIYLWPTSYQYKRQNNVVVKILFLDIIKEKNSKDYTLLDEAVCLLSSMIVDVHYSTFKPELLEVIDILRRECSMNREFSLSVCNNIHFMLRISQNSQGYGSGVTTANTYVKQVLEPQQLHELRKLARWNACFGKTADYAPADLLNNYTYWRHLQQFCLATFLNLTMRDLIRLPLKQHFQTVVNHLNSTFEKRCSFVNQDIADNWGKNMLNYLTDTPVSPKENNSTDPLTLQSETKSTDLDSQGQESTKTTMKLPNNSLKSETSTASCRSEPVKDSVTSESVITDKHQPSLILNSNLKVELLDNIGLNQPATSTATELLRGLQKSQLISNSQINLLRSDSAIDLLASNSLTNLPILNSSTNPSKPKSLTNLSTSTSQINLPRFNAQTIPARSNELTKLHLDIPIIFPGSVLSKNSLTKSLFTTSPKPSEFLMDSLNCGSSPNARKSDLTTSLNVLERTVAATVEKGSTVCTDSDSADLTILETASTNLSKIETPTKLPNQLKPLCIYKDPSELKYLQSYSKEQRKKRASHPSNLLFYKKCIEDSNRHLNTVDPYSFNFSNPERASDAMFGNHNTWMQHPSKNSLCLEDSRSTEYSTDDLVDPTSLQTPISLNQLKQRLLRKYCSPVNKTYQVRSNMRVSSFGTKSTVPFPTQDELSVVLPVEKLTSECLLRLLKDSRSISDAYDKLFWSNLKTRIFSNDRELFKLHGAIASKLTVQYRIYSQNIKAVDLMNSLRIFFFLNQVEYVKYAGKKRQEIINFCSTCTQDLRQHIHKDMQQCILTLTTNPECAALNQIPLFYTQQLNRIQTFELYSADNEITYRIAEARKHVERNIKTHEDLLNHLKNSFTAYTTIMNSKLETFLWLRMDEFEELHQQAATKSNQELVRTGCQNTWYYYNTGITSLYEQYNNRNSTIIDSEIEMTSTYISEVVDFYKNTMMFVIQNNIYSTLELESIHGEIKLQCVLALKKTVKFIMPECTAKLESQIEQASMQIKQINFTRTKLAFKKINTDISNYCKIYNEAMYSLLPPNDSLLTDKLLLYHTETTLETIHLLELHLKTADDWVSSYSQNIVQVLKNQIELDFNHIQEANSKRCSNNSSFNNLGYKQLETDSQQFLRKPIDQLNKDELVNNRAASGSDKLSQNNFLICPNTELQHIAVEFGSFNINVAIMTKNGVKIHLNVLPSAKFGITSDSKVCIGNDDFTSCIATFYLSDILGRETSPTHEYQCIINNQLRFFRKEFLCGLLLSRIKLDAELQIRNEITTIVLTVPLSYTLLQRQSTKDAAQIAGFQQVYLITENSAAAFYLVNTAIRRGSPKPTKWKIILTIVCNNYHLNAAVFKHKGGEITMVTNCGNLANFEIEARFCERLKAFFFPKKNSHHYKSKSISRLESLICYLKNEFKHFETIIVDVGNISFQTEKFAKIIKIHGYLFPERKHVVIKGAAQFANLMFEPNSKLASEELIADLPTYKFVYKDKIGEICRYIRNVEIQIFGDKLVQQIEMCEPRNRTVDVFEVVGNKFVLVGAFQVKGFASINQLTLNDQYSDLVFKFESRNSSCKSAQWNPVLWEDLSALTNLKKKEYRDWLTLFNKIADANHSYDDSKLKLLELVKALQPVLDRVPNLFGQIQLKMEIEEALSLINDPKTDKSLLEVKIDILHNLQTKYIV